MTPLPAEIRSNSGSFRGRCSSMPYSRHEGRQAKCAKHRTGHEGASGLMEIQWLPGFKSAGDRLGKRAGVQPEGGWRPFGYFSGEGKVPLRSKPASKKKREIPRWETPAKNPGPGKAPLRSRPATGASALHRLAAPARPVQSGIQGQGECRRRRQRGRPGPRNPRRKTKAPAAGLCLRRTLFCSLTPPGGTASRWAFPPAPSPAWPGGPARRGSPQRSGSRAAPPPPPPG